MCLAGIDGPMVRPGTKTDDSKWAVAVVSSRMSAF